MLPLPGNNRFKKNDINKMTVKWFLIGTDLIDVFASE